MSPSSKRDLHNSLIIDGELGKTPQTRVSPAGIPITRLVLRHRSQQSEAGMSRPAHCKLVVMACGTAFQTQLQGMQAGTMVRVSGFLSSTQNRFGNEQLVLHAEQIETINQ